MGVAPAAAADVDAARVFATALNVPYLDCEPRARAFTADELYLRLKNGVPAICLTGKGAPGPVPVGFEDPALAARRQAGHNELLGRAVGWKQAQQPRVLDTTGGFARDAFVLADLGCEVLFCERQPLLAALLADALERARRSCDPWLQDVSSRMRFHKGDARSVPAAALEQVDCIYLDPMFPVDRKAAPGKEMQVLQRLMLAENDVVNADAPSPGGDVGASADALLDWALRQPVKRVVVKRPRRAASLEGPKPGHSLQGRSVRFDVYPRATAGTEEE